MEATPGQTVERPVKWPEDFPDEAQRGQTKAVRVTLRDVKRRALPPLDDAFAREVGDFESKDALIAAVREDLGRHAEREADAEVRRRLLDDIGGANPFELPPSWVQRLVDAYASAYQVPDAGSSQVRDRVPAGGREPGAPRADHRDARRARGPGCDRSRRG